MIPYKILLDAFKGKSIRYKKSDKNIIQRYNEIVKKSNSVTDKQFASGNPKYQMVAERTKVIGRHIIYETAKIKDVIVTTCYSGDEEPVLMLELENGDNVRHYFYDDIEIIDK